MLSNRSFLLIGLAFILIAVQAASAQYTISDCGNISVEKSLFENKQDETAIVAYVKKQLENNIPDIEIRKLLLSKSWENSQIDYALAKAKKLDSNQI